MCTLFTNTPAGDRRANERAIASEFLRVHRTNAVFYGHVQKAIASGKPVSITVHYLFEVGLTLAPRREGAFVGVLATPEHRSWVSAPAANTSVAPLATLIPGRTTNRVAILWSEAATGR
jgi:hypothetical protein